MSTSKIFLWIMACLLCVNSQQYNRTYVRRADLQPLITFFINVLQDSYSLKKMLDPLMLGQKPIKAGPLTIWDIKLFGQSNIKPATENMIDFDGRNIYIGGLISINYMQFSIAYKWNFLPRSQHLSGHINQVSVAYEAIVPVDGVTPAILPVFRVVEVAGFRATNAKTLIKLVANARLILNIIVNVINKMGKPALQKTLQKLKYPPPKYTGK